jgi:uncharacterized protein YukE
MTDSGIVDCSGAVSSILAGYRRVLVEYQQMVTGDPDALTAAAQRRSGQATAVTGQSHDLVDAATKLHTDWDGDAYSAYATASGKVGTELGTIGTKLDAQAMLLTGAATALRTAKATVDAVLAKFDQYAASLTSQSRMSASGSVNAFFAAAKQAGETAVSEAKSAADQLNSVLGQLAPKEPETEIGRLEHDLGKYGSGALHWLNGEPLDGRSRPKGSPSWFGNSGWNKITEDGLEGTRAPKKADTPFGQPEPEGIAGKTEITYYKDQVNQDGLDPERDFKVTSQGGQGKITGHAQLAAFDETAQAQVQYGVADAHAKVSGFVGGEVTGSLTGGVNGVGAHVDAFVGGKVEGEVAGDVAGVGVGANGTLQYGLGAQLDGQAVYDAGHIKVNFKAGAAVGVGFGVGAKIDLDLPKMYHSAEEYGGAVVDGVSGAAHEAANALGSAWSGASAYASSW